MKDFRKKIVVLSGMLVVLAAGFFTLDVRGNEDGAPPRTPQGFSLLQGKDGIQFAWKENTEWDMFSYVLYVRTAAETEPSEAILTGQRSDFELRDLDFSGDVFVSLAARDNAGNISEPTPEIGFSVSDSFGGGKTLHGWVPATSDQLDAVVSFEKNMELFSTISPFVYAVEENGSIVQNGNVFSDQTTERAKEGNVRIVPSITNNFDKDENSTRLFRNQDSVQAHIDAVVKLVEDNDFDGVDIDYENMQPDVKDSFSGFVEQLAEQLHAKGKILSVTLQAKRGDDQSWRGVGSQDFERIGDVADQVRIMAYDYSRINTQPGPVAPIEWFEEVLTYASSKIDADKVIAGVPTYGYRWCIDKKNDLCVSDGLVWAGVQRIIAEYEPQLEWNGSAQTPYFLYKDGDENSFAVNYENKQSISAKLAVVSELGLGGVSLWRLGNEDPEVFTVLQDQLLGGSGVLKNVSVEPMNGEVKITWEGVQQEGYRVSYYSKNQEERFVDVFGDNEYVIPALENGEQYTVAITPLIEVRSVLNSSQEFRASLNEARQVFTVTPLDLAYPGTISDVKIEEIASSHIDLSFSVSGDEYFEGRAERIEIRYFEKEITHENYFDAKIYKHTPDPGKPGERIDWQVRDLEGGTEYWFAVRAYDESGNYSDLSNIVSAKTIDVIPPKIPELSTVVGKDQHAEIVWKANNENDLGGYLLYFREGNSAYQEILLGKDKNHVIVPELDNNTEYSVAIAAYDLNGNESVRSADVVVIPRSENGFSRFSEDLLLDKEKIQGSLYIFSGKLAEGNALPYLAMLAVIVINIFIYFSFKGEIVRIVGRREMVGEEDDVVVRKGVMSDLK